MQYGSMVVINTSEKKGSGFYITRLTVYCADNPVSWLQMRFIFTTFMHSH